MCNLNILENIKRNIKHPNITSAVVCVCVSQRPRSEYLRAEHEHEITN